MIWILSLFAAAFAGYMVAILCVAAGQESRPGSQEWLDGWGSGWSAAHDIHGLDHQDPVPTYRTKDQQAIDAVIRQTGGRP